MYSKRDGRGDAGARNSYKVYGAKGVGVVQINLGKQATLYAKNTDWGDHNRDTIYFADSNNRLRLAIPAARTLGPSTNPHDITATPVSFADELYELYDFDEAVYCE